MPQGPVSAVAVPKLGIQQYLCLDCPPVIVSLHPPIASVEDSPPGGGGGGHQAHTRTRPTPLHPSAQPSPAQPKRPFTPDNAPGAVLAVCPGLPCTPPPPPDPHTIMVVSPACNCLHRVKGCQQPDRS